MAMVYKPMWHYRPVDYGEPLQDLDHVLEQLTIATPLGGERVRVLLDNSLNDGELLIDRIELSRSGDDGTNWQVVTTDGCPQACLAPGERRWSDPVTLPITAGGRLVLRLWIRSLAGLRGMCQTWAAHTWQSTFAYWDDAGKEPSAWQRSAQLVRFLEAGANETTAAIGVSQVDVETNADVRTIALFGDSITHMSYYSDALAKRLLREAPGGVVVANAGLAGNRLCYDATYAPDLGVHSAMFGPAGYARFEEDLFGTMQPDGVLVMEGINDVTHCFQFGHLDQTPTVKEFCAHLAEVTAIAHAHGARVYLCTIMPQVMFAGEPWLPESESLRRGINEWILGQDVADGVVDFASLAESLLGDATTFFADGLHPNDRGGAAMAAIVPIDEMLR